MSGGSSKWSLGVALIFAGRDKAEEGSTLYLTDLNLHFVPCHLRVEASSSHISAFFNPVVTGRRGRT